MNTGRWRVATMALAAALLVTLGGVVGYALGRNRVGTASVAASWPSPPSITSQATVTPTPEAGPSPTPSTTPVISTPTAAPQPLPPAKAQFVLVSTDWRACSDIHCYAHGIFSNIGQGYGNAVVTFRHPTKPSDTCSSTLPLTPPGSAAEAACDLGGDAASYYGYTSPNDLRPPSATIRNP